MDWANFVIPLMPGYKDKDEHFVKWITGKFQACLQKMEDLLSASSGKFLLGNHMTIGDIIMGSLLMRLCNNNAYEHNLILTTIVNKYPKTKEFSAMMDAEFKDLVASFNSGF